MHNLIALCHMLLLAALLTLPSSAAAEWPFTPPGLPAIPAVEDADGWCQNPLDQFVLARLKNNQLVPSPAADRATLIRRLSIDLTGLLPSPVEVDRFVSDKSPDAWARLVERILASPRYGEHWAQHWLDVVRYADSDGFEYDDPRPHAWRYRDWVINAFNTGKPFDRFVREQIAGDEFYPGDMQALVATGMQRLGPLRLNAGMQDAEKNRQEVLTEMIDNIGAAFLGMTIGCARCHDHKFDNFLQADYFRLQSFFAATQPTDISLASEAAQAEYEQQLAAWQKDQDGVQQRVDELRETYRERIQQDRLETLPIDVQAAVKKDADQRTATDIRLVAEANSILTLTTELIDREILKAAKDRAEFQQLMVKLTELFHARPRAPLTVMAAIDPPGEVPATHVLDRGVPGDQLDRVEPGFPAMLAVSARSANAAIQPVPLDEGNSSGRRTALANWLVRKDHPLTARVFVNRIWHHHLGRGIVNTPNDFGAMGAAASHPQLLDWLTVELIHSGWDIKHLHQLVLLSSTYQQQSRRRDQAFEADPENRYLWRANRQRMDAEVLRDTMLQLSGDLNGQAGGPGVRLPLHPELARLQYKGSWHPHPDPLQHLRRSIYVFVKRNNRPALMESFDSPSTMASCGIRSHSTHAGQALALLNSSLSQRQSLRWAARLQTQLGHRPASWIGQIYQQALARPPTREEMRLGKRYLAEQQALIAADRQAGATLTDDDRLLALADYCQVIMNLDEFLFVR
jgi:hypothetical protein